MAAVSTTASAALRSSLPRGRWATEFACFERAQRDIRVVDGRGRGACGRGEVCCAPCGKTSGAGFCFRGGYVCEFRFAARIEAVRGRRDWERFCGARRGFVEHCPARRARENSEACTLRIRFRSSTASHPAEMTARRLCGTLRSMWRSVGRSGIRTRRRRVVDTRDVDALARIIAAVAREW